MLIEPQGPRYKFTRETGIVKVEIPARRNWFVVLFLCAWMGGWVMGEVSVIQELIHPTEKTSFPFLLFWLAGWTVGGVVAAGTLLWQLAGREVLSISGGILAYRVEALGAGVSRAYRISDIKDLRTIEVSVATGVSQSSYFPPLFGNNAGTIAFDFGARTVRLAPGLDAAEAKLLAQELEAKLHRPMGASS